MKDPLLGLLGFKERSKNGIAYNFWAEKNLEKQIIINYF